MVKHKGIQTNLTNLCRADSTITLWTGPFAIEGDLTSYHYHVLMKFLYLMPTV